MEHTQAVYLAHDEAAAKLSTIMAFAHRKYVMAGPVFGFTCNI